MNNKNVFYCLARLLPDWPLPFHGVFVLTMLLIVGSAAGGSATWKLNPTNNDWNTAANWMPGDRAD